MSPSAVQPKNKGPKACTTCAKAKARCVPGPDGSLKCDRILLSRCHRLDKPCVSQTPAPPRPRKSPKLSKIAALEKRLEELSSQVQHDSPEESPTPSTPSPTGEKQSGLRSNTDKWGFDHIFPPKQGAEDSPGSHPPPSAPDKPRPTVHAALFPFVLVPEHMTALELREHRPFLWKAVMMVGCFLDGARQIKLGEELLTEIGRAAVVDGLKTLDLLHGLQILVSWFHYALKGSQVTNLLFLARSMCVNLGFKEDGSLQGDQLTQNLDHMRAYAGTYYLNTLVFTANKRPDVLMNTNSLEACCKVLETTMQYPSDEYLVKLVRIQQLAQSISLTMAEVVDGHQAMKLPLTMVVRSFQDQLDQYRESLGPRLCSNDNLKAHVNVAEVLLYEIAISDQHTTASYLPLTERLQLLWGCLRALKSFFDIRFSHRELERPRFLCLSASDFVYTIITGIKLMMLQLPGWNPTTIHNELDVVEVMDQQVRDLVVIVARRKHGNLLGTPAPPGVPTPQPPEDPFDRLTRQLKALSELVKVELERMRAGSANTAMVDFSQDFLMGDMGGDFWQSTSQGFNVWNIVGDPGVLDDPIP
ncbi:cercosporin resistance [Fusarium albosuccineum]|uniref:Cercosporin resistance n=1 Tax=Fusarium albosuccineum TaxID=1237068 RepID=A0A8H4L3V7_9HYPO|nr:cercosporin resistance [Fusarium albosuccineum]KAF5004284.1 hypothetical protein FDECE_9219 [Fusarium decemcellulare]